MWLVDILNAILVMFIDLGLVIPESLVDWGCLFDFSSVGNHRSWFLLSVAFLHVVAFMLLVAIRLTTPRFRFETLSRLGWLYGFAYIGLLCFGMWFGAALVFV